MLYETQVLEAGAMNPYYSHAGITIHHCDCREILDELPMFDLLLTDPPYGIEADNRKRIMSRGKLANPKDYGESNWDKSPVSEEMMLQIRAKAEKQIIFGGNYYALPPSPCWLIWDKENTGDFADAEMAWTNLKGAVRLKRHMWNGMLRKGGEDRFHPTQKPLEVIAWALGHAGDVKTVIDPFMGSGTTLRACKDAGISCVGVEREERYAEIAAKRLEQEVFAF